MIYVIFTCDNFNEVVDTAVETFRKFFTSALVDIEKNGTGQMNGIRT